MIMLSPHFHIDEFRSQNGEPAPRRAHESLRVLCVDHLEPLRAVFGVVTVTSGFRTRAHNREVGGAPASFHRYDITGRWGVAADVVCATGTPAEWAGFLELAGPKHNRGPAGGIGRYATFVHVDNRRGHARWRG